MGDFSFFFRVDFFLFFSWAGGCSPSGVTFEDMTRKEGRRSRLDAAEARGDGRGF